MVELTGSQASTLEWALACHYLEWDGDDSDLIEAYLAACVERGQPAVFLHHTGGQSNIVVEFDHLAAGALLAAELEYLAPTQRYGWNYLLATPWDFRELLARDGSADVFAQPLASQLLLSTRNRAGAALLAGSLYHRFTVLDKWSRTLRVMRDAPVMGAEGRG